MVPEVTGPVSRRVIFGVFLCSKLQIFLSNPKILSSWDAYTLHIVNRAETNVSILKTYFSSSPRIVNFQILTFSGAVAAEGIFGLRGGDKPSVDP